MSDRRLRRGNWGVQELERLRQLLPRRGVADTALLLRRSEASVLRKAMDLLRVPARRGAWTASDDERLRESWGALDPRLLAPMLGRPVAEVRKRAVELRNSLRSGPWSRGEIQALKELYGTRRDDDLEIGLLRPAAEIERMARRLCLAKDKRFAALAAKDTGGLVGVVAGVSRREMPRWSSAEIDRLRELYPDRDNLSVARELGRTVASVANKANLLGLKKSAGLLAEIGRSNVVLRYEPRAAEGSEAN